MEGYIIKYCPELNVWTLSNGGRDKVITQADIDGRLAPCRPLFEQAKAAAENGKLGVFVN